MKFGGDLRGAPLEKGGSGLRFRCWKEGRSEKERGARGERERVVLIGPDK